MQTKLHLFINWHFRPICDNKKENHKIIRRRNRIDHSTFNWWCCDERNRNFLPPAIFFDLGVKLQNGVPWGCFGFLCWNCVPGKNKGLRLLIVTPWFWSDTDRIQTCDLLIRSQMLYSAKLRCLSFCECKYKSKKYFWQIYSRFFLSFLLVTEQVIP